MTKGRKPIPNQLKKLKGTDQPCRIRGEVEVEKISKMPPPPKWLSKISKKLYRSKSQYLIDADIMAGTDIEMFVSFCHEFGRYMETSEQLVPYSDADKTLSKSEKEKFGRLMKINKESFERAKQLSSEFGFSPVSRMKFNVKQEEKDPLQALLDQYNEK